MLKNFKKYLKYKNKYLILKQLAGTQEVQNTPKYIDLCDKWKDTYYIKNISINNKTFDEVKFWLKSTDSTEYIIVCTDNKQHEFIKENFDSLQKHNKIMFITIKYYVSDTDPINIGPDFNNNIDQLIEKLISLMNDSSKFVKYINIIHPMILIMIHDINNDINKFN